MIPHLNLEINAMFEVKNCEQLLIICYVSVDYFCMDNPAFVNVFTTSN